MNLHEEYYGFRDRVWKAFEELVHAGCERIGHFPIVICDLDLKELKEGDRCPLVDTIIIYGIVKDEKYSIFPPQESERDIHVTTNKIKVLAKHNPTTWEKIEMEVEPDLLDLQELSTYLSGGISVYKD